jgi:Fe2+ or Zn2+ uptake regulation protein
MTAQLDAEWRRLSANRRDVLVALAAVGPASGAAVHRWIRGEGEPQTQPTTQRHLSDLADRGYVARDHQGGCVENRLTDEGALLVESNVVGIAADLRG